MDRLSGLDASFLYFEDSAQLMHVCALLVLDPTTVPGGYRFDTFREVLRKRVQLSPTFRRKLHDHPLNLDHPVWIDDTAFDIEHHVRRIAVPAPGRRDELAEVCADIAAHALDRTRPLWEFWVIEGLADGQIAVLTKMHHAIADGVTGSALIGSLCSLAADAEPLITAAAATPPKPPESPEPPGPVRDRDIILDGLLRYAKRPLRLPALLPRTIGVVPSWIRRGRHGIAMPAPFSAPRTSFNGTLTSHRAVAFTRLDLDAVKTVKNAFGATVNDVVLALCSSALRAYLDGNGELPNQPLVAMVPVSVHGRGGRGRTDGTGGTNQVSGMFTPLATQLADPAARLRAIAEQTRIAKEHHRSISASMLQDWAQFAPANALALGIRLAGRLRLAEHAPVLQNLIISNVPGPPAALYFAGARLVGFYPFGPVFHGAGVNITVVSHDGALDVGIIACRELAPRLWDLADRFPVALTELVSAAAASTAPARADPPRAGHRSIRHPRP